jgi:alkylation response protein AidB-like acyl-CoA dehydrogenase
MNFAFSEEQDELRASVRRFLEEKSPITTVRRSMELPEEINESLWAQASDQLGLCALAVPESYGGLGYGTVELGIVLEEFGRALTCLPFFSSVVLGVSTLVHFGDEETKKALLPAAASGERRYAVGFFEAASGFETSHPQAVAVLRDGSYRITGEKAYVIDGATATDLLILANTEDGPRVFHVISETEGLTQTAVLSLDQTRHLATVNLRDVVATPLGTTEGVQEKLSAVLDTANAMLSCEMVGGAQRCLDMAVDYAKVRIQFGRPIGSFQAIKHKCADMLVEVESAKSAAYYAAWAAANDRDELRIAAPLAKAFCGDAYFSAAAENIQIHGGIGFTWEHDAHLYFKRAKSSQLMFGDSAHYREVIAERIGL